MFSFSIVTQVVLSYCYNHQTITENSLFSKQKIRKERKKRKGKHTYSEGSISAAMLMLSPAGAAPDWNGGGSAPARRSLEPRESRLPGTTHYTCFSCVSHFFAAGSSPKPCDCSCHTKSWSSAPPSLTHADTKKKHFLGTLCEGACISTTDRIPWLRVCSPSGTIVHEPKHFSYNVIYRKISSLLINMQM